MLKGKSNKSRVILGSLLILLGIALPVSKYLYLNYLDNKNNESIETFFETEEQETIVEDSNTDQEEVKTNNNSYNYIAVLEVPSISLKRGLVDKNSNANNVSKNIQILNESDMPDVKNGTMYLASHSGSSYIAFFKHLDKVKIDDLVYIYYNHIKYTYKVTKMYEEVKDGNISVYKDKSKTNLILTTCNPSHKGYQLIVVSELINQENY